MVDRRLRQYKEQALATLAMRLPSWLHPTHVTVLAFGVGIMAAITVGSGNYGLGLALWLLNRLLDGLDGTVARMTQKQSDFGGYLDILLDTAMYAAIPAALAFSIGTPTAYISVIVLLITFYLNASSWMYLAAVLEKRQQGAKTRGEVTTITMPDGLLEGAETVLFFVLFLLLPSAAVPLFLIMALLTVATFVHRTWWAAKVLA